MTYDPVTGFPATGTVRWMEHHNDTFLEYFSEETGGQFFFPAVDSKLSNLVVTDIAELNGGGYSETYGEAWFKPSGYYWLSQFHNGTQLTLENVSGPVDVGSGDDIVTLKGPLLVMVR